MKFEWLRSFVVLAERLHFGAAAQVLSLSQPALSNQIRQLEEELGALLFDRGRHGAQLTDVGTVFLEEARGLLQHADRVIETGRRAGRGETGHLGVGFGFSTIVLVPRIVSKFRKRRPEVRIDLQEMSSLEQVDALRAGRIHVGFIRMPIPKEFRQLPILEDRLMLITPKGERSRSSNLADYASASFIMARRSLSVNVHDHVLRMCSKYGFHPRVVQEANEDRTIPALVAAGLGVALIPESQLRPRVEGITVHTLDDEMARWQVAAAWRRSKGSPLTKEFLELLKAELSMKPLDSRPTGAIASRGT